MTNHLDLYGSYCPRGSHGQGLVHLATEASCSIFCDLDHDNLKDGADNEASKTGHGRWSCVRFFMTMTMIISKTRLQRLVIAGGLAYAFGMKPYFRVFGA